MNARSPDRVALAGEGGSLRVDKWLWYARFFKSRSRAAQFCAAGRLRVSRRILRKAHHAVRPGDVLTFPLGGRIRVIRVLALARRRAGAGEAAALYDDLSPPAVPSAVKATPALGAPPAPRERGAGRPTKAERRATARLRGRP